MMRKWLSSFDFVVGGSLSAFAVEGKEVNLGRIRELVYKVDIKDEIGPSIWRLVKGLLTGLRTKMQMLFFGTHEHVRGNGGVCRFCVA